MSPSVAKLGLSLFAVLLALVGAEVMLRIMGYEPLGALARGRELTLRVSQWDDLGYQLTPNAETRAWRTTVQTNSHGFRDREYPFEKDGRFRILVIGDSISFGKGVAVEDVYPERLERALSETLGRSVDVINLSVGGYDAVQEVASLEHLGLAFDPDLVVLGLCTNDIGDASVNLDYIRSLETLQSPLYKLRTVQFVRVTWDRLEKAYNLFTGRDDEVFAEAKARYIAPLGDDPELTTLMTQVAEFAERIKSEDPMAAVGRSARVRAWYGSEAHVGMLEYALARLARLSREGGFPVFVAILPKLETDPTQEWVHGILAHQVRKHGFPYLDLRPAFDAAGPEDMRVSPNDLWHPDAAGHALIATELEAALRASGLLPAAADADGASAGDAVGPQAAARVYTRAGSGGPGASRM